MERVLSSEIVSRFSRAKQGIQCLEKNRIKADYQGKDSGTEGKTY